MLLLELKQPSKIDIFYFLRNFILLDVIHFFLMLIKKTVVNVSILGSPDVWRSETSFYCVQRPCVFDLVGLIVICCLLCIPSPGCGWQCCTMFIWNRRSRGLASPTVIHCFSSSPAHFWCLQSAPLTKYLQPLNLECATCVTPCIRACSILIPTYRLIEVIQTLDFSHRSPMS